MTLPNVLSFDTESGICPDGELRNVVIQYCPRGARKLEDVKVLIGEDCYDRFFAEWDNVDDVHVHVYNLNWEGGNKETDGFIDWLKHHGFMWKTGKRLQPMEWDCVETDDTLYSVRAMNASGSIMSVTDDWQLIHQPLKDAVKDVLKEEKYRKIADSVGVDGKEQTEEYEVWYTYGEEDERWKKFIHYSTVDAFIQALVSEWLYEHGRDLCLTSATAGFKNAVACAYGNGRKFSELSSKEMHFAMKQFLKEYPPLCHRMQVVAEESIVGGFAWGLIGIWLGIFSHGDYSSSYPFEYKFGRLFIGEVKVAERMQWELIMKNDNLIKWVIVSFDFEIVEGMPPCISGDICDEARMNFVWGRTTRGHYNDKMDKGSCVKKLMTQTYWDNIVKKCYNVMNVEMHEVWYARANTGRFGQFVEQCYELKSVMEGLEKQMEKNDMNASMHGKTVQKVTRTVRVEYPGNVRTLIYTTPENNPDTVSNRCYMIGFTAMFNARERLLSHCIKLIEAGKRIMMCDTDSIVADCSGEEYRRIVGDWFVKDIPKKKGARSLEEIPMENRQISNLGKFEMEKDSDGNENFNEFRCWGLKRYLELNNGKFRKSAFAGMDKKIQKEILIKIDEAEIGKTVISYVQKAKKQVGRCYALRDIRKDILVESVWYNNK